MGRAPCCDKAKVKRGPWSPEEDNTLKNYIHKHGTGGNWIALPLKAGLKRCGKSCRLRWLNYLRPNIKHGGFTEEEDNIIITLYNSLGSRWSVIASNLQGRTDNDVKNYWNTKLKKKLMARTTSFTTTTTTTTTTTAATISNKATFNIPANNFMHTYNTTLPLAPPIYNNNNVTNYYENFQIFPRLISAESTQSTLPKLIEIQENAATFPSPQDFSSFSPSFSQLESNCASWIDKNAGYEDGFFMDFAPATSSSDLLEGIFYQENIETSPNLSKCVYSNFFDISNIDPSSSFPIS